jgi:hypothetical protein
VFGMFVIWWFVHVFVVKEYKIVGSPLHFFNLALLICAILSMTNSGLLIAFNMLPLVKAMIFSFFIVDIVRSKEWTVYFLKTLLVVTVLSALIGIFQEIVFLLRGTILVEVDQKSLKFILESTPFGTFLRVPAYTGMHLFLANYLVISILIGLNAFLYFNTIMTRREKSFLKFAIVIMAAALVLTFSKTNMLGLAFGITLSIFMKWRQRSIHFVFLLLLVLVATYYFGLWDMAYKHFAKDLELSGDLGLRVQLMKRGIEGFIYKYTLLGVGIGRGGEYTRDVMGWGAHNAFILAADEVGIIGFTVFLSLFMYAFYRLITAISVLKEPYEKNLVKMLLAGLTAYVVNIQFQPDFLSYYNWLLIGFIESTVIVLRKESRQPTQPSPPIYAG